MHSVAELSITRQLACGDCDPICTLQVNELKAEVAKFATIRDTLAYSADVLRDITAQQKCVAPHVFRGCEQTLPVA